MNTTQYISTQRKRVNNHHVIKTDKYVYLQSYNSIVVRLNMNTKKIVLGTDWCYSQTTIKYVKDFIQSMTQHLYSKEELKQTFKVENLSIK